MPFPTLKSFAISAMCGHTGWLEQQVLDDLMGTAHYRSELDVDGAYQAIHVGFHVDAVGYTTDPKYFLHSQIARDANS